MLGQKFFLKHTHTHSVSVLKTTGLGIPHLSLQIHSSCLGKPNPLGYVKGFLASVFWLGLVIGEHGKKTRDSWKKPLLLLGSPFSIDPP